MAEYQAKTWIQLAALPVGEVDFPRELPQNLRDQLKEWMLANNTNLIPQDIYCIQNPWVFRFHDNTKSALATKAVYVTPDSYPPEVVEVTPFHLYWMTQDKRGRSSQRLLVVMSNRFGAPVILRRKRVQSNDFVIWRGLNDSRAEPTALIKVAETKPSASDDAAPASGSIQPSFDMIPEFEQGNTVMPGRSPDTPRPVISRDMFAIPVTKPAIRIDGTKPELNAPGGGPVVVHGTPFAVGNYVRTFLDPKIGKSKRISGDSSTDSEQDENVKKEVVDGAGLGNVATSASESDNALGALARTFSDNPDLASGATGYLIGGVAGNRAANIADDPFADFDGDFTGNNNDNLLANSLTLSRRYPSMYDRLSKTTFHFHGPIATRSRTLAQIGSMDSFLANIVSADMFSIGDAIKVVVCDWYISNSLSWRKVIGDWQDWEELNREVLWANAWTVDGATCTVDVHKKWY